MQKPSRKTEWVVWGALVLTLLSIAAAFVRSKFLQAGRPVELPLAYALPDFTLTNQNGRAVSLADLRGQVWVADIIFTRCAGPCPRLTEQMSQLQSALSKDPVKLVSLTTDPEFDTAEVLKRYGERFAATPDRWMFLTGAKEQIARLAIDGLKLAAVEKKPEERENERDLFIHSLLLVVVDQKGRLRASFESDDPDWKPKVLAAVRKLLREP